MGNDFTINQFIQSELSKRRIEVVTAVEAARWLGAAGVLKDSGSRPGLPLRRLLRDGKIQGGRQEPSGRWFIDRTNNNGHSNGAATRSRREPIAPFAEPTAVADERAALDRFAAARRKYKPNVIRCILIAESPPAADSGRFFYFEHVLEKDSLFWETMKALYPGDLPDTGYPRDRKGEFLERFRANGFYLVDSVEEPLGKISSAAKRRRIRESLPRLRKDLRQLCQTKTWLVLISAPVYDVCADALKADGFLILNGEMIDFPGSGCQRKFREKFRRAIGQL